MSTLERDSLSNLIPNSLVHYKSATRKIFGEVPYISKKDYKKFDTFDKTLHSLDIYPHDYAYRLLNHLKSWVLDKQWRFMPVNVFTGKWALDLYQREIGNRSYEILTLDEEQRQVVIYEEFTILQFTGECGSYEKAVEFLWPVLSKCWKNISEADREEIMEKAQDLYLRRYGVMV